MWVVFLHNGVRFLKEGSAGHIISFSLQIARRKGLNKPDSGTVLPSLAEEKPKLLELFSKSVAGGHL